MEHQTLEQSLRSGALDGRLAAVYGAEGLEKAKERCAAAAAGFTKTFESTPEAFFSAPGRTELGGNHTDHQHGRVLAAAVDLDILAAATPNQSGMLRIQSQGYPMIVVDLRELTPQSGEENTSAAFEVLIGTMLSELFWDGKCSAVEIAQIGQYAENVFFGKPCGLMDQTASSVGGVVAIDFADTASPVVDSIALDLHAKGYALCILDSGAGHADLTGEYAAITDELKAVCRCFGKEVLREVPEADFMAGLPQVRQAAGDRGALRALHVYAENRRAAAQADALRSGDFDGFLALVRESGRSSAMYLQNVVPTGSTEHQELMVTLALCEAILAGRGAVRVHGGGFGGTAQAFVPLDLLEEFKEKTEAVLGQGSCHVVTIRPVGGVRLG